MNMKKQLATLFLFGLIFSLILTSCKKDDGIAINQLVGKWYIYNDDPNLSVDGSVTYTFNVDKTCLIHSTDFLSGHDTIISRTYVVGAENTLVTLFNKEGRYTEQYTIRKLTSKEMIWENASSTDGNSDKKLRKAND
jgi:hypothetical protein